MTVLTRINQQLASHQREHLTRHRSLHDDNAINFSTNDYLALAKHPTVTRAFIASAEQYGVGSGASPQLSGYSRAHQRLEEAFSEYTNRDRAILFNSGYHANLGVITTLATRHSTIIADKYCHASIIDAIILSRANHLRYRHNNIQHAISLLNNHERAIVISESVFSIHGDLANIRELADAAAIHQHFLIVDDAHGFGVLGKHGKGVCEHFALSQHAVPCLITPLGKAFGSMGALVAGHHDFIEALLQFSRPYRYSTALPAALCDATHAALMTMQKENWRVSQLHANIEYFIQAALERELTLTSHDITPIKSIIVPSNQAALSIQEQLKSIGFLVSCIRPPTIPKPFAMIRISLSCAHTQTQIIHLLDLLRKLIDAATNEPH